MPGRRLILLLVLLLVSLSVLSATRDISRQRLPALRTTPTTTGTTDSPAQPKADEAPGKRPEQSVAAARLPRSRPVAASLGQRVILTIDSDRPDVAVIDPLGVRAPVGPDTEGTLDFVADQPGDFTVKLGIGGRRVGEVRVAG